MPKYAIDLSMDLFIAFDYNCDEAKAPKLLLDSLSTFICVRVACVRHNHTLCNTRVHTAHEILGPGFLTERLHDFHSVFVVW